MEPGCYRNHRDVLRKELEGPGFRNRMVERGCRRELDCHHSRKGAAAHKKAVGHKHRETRRLVAEAGHREAVGRMKSAEMAVAVGHIDPEAGSRLAGSHLGLGRTSRLR